MRYLPSWRDELWDFAFVLVMMKVMQRRTCSLAVSIKMNVLLFAPAVFFILLLNNGPAKTTFLLAVCGVVQVPFDLCSFD